MTSLSLDEFVGTELQTPSGEVGYDELRQFWLMLFPAEVRSSQTGWEVFTRAVASGTGQIDPSPLAFRPGGFKLKVKGPGITSAVAAGLLAGALAIAGVAVIPALVLPAILPLVFQLERVELTKGDEYILAKLQLQPSVREGKLTTEELYALLPDDLRAHLAMPDLLDFLERCRAAGVADVDVAGVRLGDPGQAKFRVTIQ